MNQSKNIQNYLFENFSSKTYYKKEPTSVRLSNSKDINIDTYVSDETKSRDDFKELTNGMFYKLETSKNLQEYVKSTRKSSTILDKLKDISQSILNKLNLNDNSNKIVIARDKDPLGVDKETGKTIYNEWMIPLSTYQSTYGDPFKLSNDNFSLQLKQTPIKAIELTQELFEDLQIRFDLKLDSSGKYLKMPLSDGKLIELEVGDFIMNNGYTIDKESMEGSYVEYNINEILKLENYQMFKDKIINKIKEDGLMEYNNNIDFIEKLIEKNDLKSLKKIFEGYEDKVQKISKTINNSNELRFN